MPGTARGEIRQEVPLRGSKGTSGATSRTVDYRQYVPHTHSLSVGKQKTGDPLATRCVNRVVVIRELYTASVFFRRQP